MNRNVNKINSFNSLARYIVGTNVWECLPEWDRKMLSARCVHKVIIKNKLL